MKNKEIEELLKYLKENDYVRLDDNRTYKLLQDDEDKLLLSYIEQLEKENQQLKENYDRIYNENCKLREEHNITDISLLDENQQLKKQKDDVVEYIKSLRIFSARSNGKTLFAKILNEILRMLGEIDE